MKREPYGSKIWVIPDGYLPEPGEMDIPGHEAICIVNTGEKEASINVTAYFEDREPLKNMKVKIGGERSLHLWLTEIKTDDGKNIPLETPYSLLVESTENIVLQHSRLDTRLGNMALFSVIGYNAET